MKSKTIKRFLIMGAALVFGLLLVFLLSIAGGKSKGPIQNILDGVANKVLDIENHYIFQKRSKKRKQKLKIFSSFKNDINALKKPKIVLLGASDEVEKESFEAIINLEDSLRTTFPLIHIYNAWGSKAQEQFPKIAVETIIELGSTPVITWEPWLDDFKEEDYPGIPEPTKRKKGCLKAIADGTYDKYVFEWAKELATIKQPVFIRWAHEMNDPYRYPWGPQNNKYEDFTDAWTHIRDIFRYAGANNAIWIWAPHPAYGHLDDYYPGEKYVDYIGIGVLNFGIATTWSKWWTFDQLFGKSYEKVDSFSKPVMITEFGSLNVGGERSEWFNDALESVATKYPAIKSVLFFHQNADKTITDKEVSWYFIEDQKSKEAIIKQLNKWPDSLKLENLQYTSKK